MPILERSVEQAQKIRREGLSKLTASQVLATIKADYDIDLTSSFLCDQQDLIGLIGEILAEDLFQSTSVTCTVVKWKTSGTSKSKGIDLLCRVTSSHPPDVLLLVESKHVHEEIRGRPSSFPSILADKFERGLSEFEEERTLFNLANVIAKLDRSIAIDRSINSNTREKQALREFIAERLSDQQYNLAVVISVDDRFSNVKLAQEATHLVHEPTWIAEHTASLFVVAFFQLEDMTDRLCGRYVTRS